MICFCTTAAQPVRGLRGGDAPATSRIIRAACCPYHTTISEVGWRPGAADRDDAHDARAMGRPRADRRVDGADLGPAVPGDPPRDERGHRDGGPVESAAAPHGSPMVEAT